MESLPIPSVELDKTSLHTVTDYGFDNLPNDTVNQIFKDGRVFSHFIEHWLAANYSLTHINGCKDHDFIDKNNSQITYDQKTFTHRGCRFMPSSMIGTGRTFNKEVFQEKASKLIYCIVSNIHFPQIKIKFIRGSTLIIKYPTGIIPFNHHDILFNPT
jgi:hypothetical protein